MWKKMQTNCIFIASNFVIHPQILIFLVSKIASCSFTCLLLRSICFTGNSSQQTSLQCLSTIKMVFSDDDKILIKNLFAISMGKTRYFEHRKYQNLWMNNKVRGDENAVCLHFCHICWNICRKYEILIS